MKIKSICYYYPPLNSSEGYSAYKMYKYSTYDIEIISQRKFSDWTYSKDDVNPKNVTYIEALNPYDWNKKVEKLDWNDTDLLITRSMPTSSHLIGLEIKKKHPQIKWIAFFSDPFSNSPLTKWETTQSMKTAIKKFKFILFFKTIVYKTLEWLIQSINEIRIYKKCDYIVFNNSYQANYMTGKKYANKIKVLPHTFDQCDISKNLVDIKNNKITFMFAGSITNARNLDNFFKAFKKIKTESVYKNKVELYIISNDEDQVYKFLNKDDVNVIKNLSYKDCFQWLMKADWLINADASCIAKYTNNYIYLPCKLIDYLSINNNILNISNFEKSPSVELVSNCGATNIKDDEQSIYNFLTNIINKNLIKSEASDYIKSYDNSVVVKDFDSLVADLIKNK